MSGQLTLLDPLDITFPDTRQALRDPNGLLAVGGDLSTPRLLQAYRRGIFPWYSQGQPLLWWSPDPRLVLFPQDLHLGRSLRKLARRRPFTISVDTAFSSLIRACAQPRRIRGALETETWITPDIRRAYERLHREGYAHSVEVWQRGELVGGLYGLGLGRVFFGESMFSRVSGASKIAFVTLAQQLAAWDYALIDCQVKTEHMLSLGAREIPRDSFEALLARNVDDSGLMESNGRAWRENWTMPEYGFD